MSTAIKASLSLVTLGGASVGGYILAGNYNDDAPIYDTKEKSTLFDTKESFRSSSLGNKFPSLFLSTRAVSNNEEWEAKKNKIISNWTTNSFFAGITKDDHDAVLKIKISCMKAYKEIPQDSDSAGNSGSFLMSNPRWWEVWRMCGKFK